jgi:hypothetical protein
MRVAALICVLLVTGCTPASEYDDPAPAQTPRATSSASAMRADLSAALQRLTGAPYTFTIAGGAPKGGTVTASGTVDPAGKRYQSTVEVTGSTPQSIKRIVVGTDTYVWEPILKAWVHLDMARVKPDSLQYFDTADPAGLAPFLAGIASTVTVRGTAPGRWTLQLNYDKVTNLPLGAPVFRSYGFGGTLPFTVTTDAQGNIATIGTTVKVTDEPEIVFTTTFTAHGAPVQINPPAKRDTREADSSYYT